MAQISPHLRVWLQERIGEVEHMLKLVAELEPTLEKVWVSSD